MKQLPKFYEDFECLHVNTEPNRCYYIPKKRQEEGMLSEQRISLNGIWSLMYATRYEKLPESIILKDFDLDYQGIDQIDVPSCLEMYGYGNHQYTNVRYPIPFDPPYVPDENPAAAYLRDFTLTEEECAHRLYLNFEGVDSCMYIWINGAFVGYSQVSHSTSEFEITKYCVAGTNRIVVLVLKWCDGTYLEDQDKLRMSGIFRDTYILLRPKTFIRDYRITTDFVGEAVLCNATELMAERATVKCTVEDFVNAEEFDTATLSLYDAKDVLIATKVSNQAELLAGVELSVERPKLWTAETPNLYRLVIETAEEVIEEAVGIRTIVVSNGVVFVNGRKIKFHGVNRHDSNADSGYTISKKQAIADLKLMKQHNINAIRTSHYPNAPWFARLCSEYGFYMIGESDIECHGVVELAGVTYSRYGLIARDEMYLSAIMDRVERNVVRDKNVPAIVIWSLGNESGYGICFVKAGAWVKEYDPTRLLQYESSVHKWHDVDPITGADVLNDDSDLSSLDFMSRMYASTEEVVEYCESEAGKTIPFIQCEYCHAMGNGPGDLEDYQELMDRYDNFSGGFIWEWCDHSVYMGTDEKGMARYFYGGDFGEKLHDGNFCMDGLVYPDRTPHTGLKEAKNVWRPLRASLIDTAPEGPILIEFKNQQNFLDATNIRISYELTVDGMIVRRGSLETLTIAPFGTKRVLIQEQYPSDRSVYLRLIYKSLEATALVEEDSELGFDQMLLCEGSIEASKEFASDSEKRIEIMPDLNESDTYTIIGDGFTYTFSGAVLGFTSLNHEVAGGELLLEPMRWNIMRAPTDNDMPTAGSWYYQLGFDRTYGKCYASEAFVTEDSTAVIRVKGALVADAIRPLMKLDLEWRISNTGAIALKVSGVRGEGLPWFPRFGLRMMVINKLSEVSYFGYGPYESYIDKHQASYKGIFFNTVAGLYEPYVKPQENGHHFGCDWMELATKELETNYGIRFASDHGFEFNASEYTIEELKNKRHRNELKKAAGYEICIDQAMSGIGSNSCGPILLPKYRLDAKECEWSLVINISRT